MATYVAIRRLVRKTAEGGKEYIEAGTKTRLEWVNEDVRGLLVRKGAVREIESPPLDTLAGWQTRARRLDPLGVQTLDDMLEADPEELAPELRVKPDTVEKWQEELRAWSEVPADPGRSR